MNLFPRDKVVGSFLGFSQGGLEFHADIVLPYNSDYQRIPMHGQFVLIALEHDSEAVLGRITSMSAHGRLTSSEGEDFILRAIGEDRPIPEDLRANHLRYRVNIRVLGVVKVINDRLTYVPSHRRLPHLGSKVAFLSDDVLKEVAGHNLEGAEIGFFSLGEFVYAGNDHRADLRPGEISFEPPILPKFNQIHLVSRRTFVFARAGFGKSNLIKLLFAHLYRETPVVPKRGGRTAKVGTVIFDPDGEYFWPDDKGRPGLCDVPHLRDKLVVFTERTAPSDYYESFTAAGIKLDIRELKPADVISIALSQDKQDQQNVRKLKALDQHSWEMLVNEIYENGNNADPNILKPLLKLEQGQEAELYAARANMTQVVRLLHDPGSTTLNMLLEALSEGKLCVIDVSQMRGEASLILSGLILSKIFKHNQEEFTSREAKTIPTIAVLEEAQSVLGQGATEGPYVSWVKEGRKYDLGAVLVTQQPGSISHELLSQGDNWFVFHLLSAGDLAAVKRANAHFSDDILSSLLNEPIVGQGVFWSSAGGTPYPIPIRVLSFEKMFATLDPQYSKGEVETFATELRKRRNQLVSNLAVEAATVAVVDEGEEKDRAEKVDIRESIARRAIKGLRSDTVLLTKIRSKDGIRWWDFQMALKDHLPQQLGDDEYLRDFAYEMVPRALNEIFGKDGWETYKNQADGKTWIRVRNSVDSSR